MVNKLPDQYECPLDIWLLRFIDTHLAWYYHHGFTPNIVTTISIILGVLSAGAIYYQHNALGAGLFLLAYYLDCVDGKLARQYQMVTPFGDLYDHFGDVVKFVLVVAALYHNNNRKLSALQEHYKTVIKMMTLFLFVQIGYQETIHNKNDSTSLALFRRCVSFDTQPERTIQYTRYLGNGTFILLFCSILLFWNHP